MNTLKKNSYKIGIDARFYGPLVKGLGRYVQEIVANVTKMDQDNYYVIFLTKDNYNNFVCENPRVKKVLADVSWYTLAEQIKMPLLIWREKIDLMHFPHFNVPIFTPVKFVVTVHDLILTKFATTRATTLSFVKYFIKNLGYKSVIWLAILRAKKVITVSEFTKNDIASQFKIKLNKIVVTLEGVASLTRNKNKFSAFRQGDRKTLLSYNIDKSFILYVGNAYPHKNLEGLIEVFGKILETKPDFRLILVGKEDYFYERVKDFALKKKLFDSNNLNSPVIFPGYVPDNELEILYKQAKAYVFPSFYEGFGLPPLEAMANSCPVASSNQSSMPEILGEAALYFDPSDQNDMLSKILKIISDENLRERLRASGLKQVKKYSWHDCASKTIEVYKTALRDA